MYSQQDIAGKILIADSQIVSGDDAGAYAGKLLEGLARVIRQIDEREKLKINLYSGQKEGPFRYLHVIPKGRANLFFSLAVEEGEKGDILISIVDGGNCMATDKDNPFLLIQNRKHRLNEEQAGKLAEVIYRKHACGVSAGFGSRPLTLQPA